MPLCRTCNKRCYGEHCFQHKPRKPIARTVIKRKPSRRTAADKAFKKLYLEQHQPDEYGYYTCYLQTTKQCLVRLLPEQVTIEHKVPKGSVKGANLRFNEENIGIACFYCNSDKGSQDLELYLEKVSKSRGCTNVSSRGSIDT